MDISLNQRFLIKYVITICQKIKKIHHLVTIIIFPGIGTLVIKTISDNVALKHKGKKIIIVCEKLRLKRDEKIIPEFSYFDQGNSKSLVNNFSFKNIIIMTFFISFYRESNHPSSYKR